MSYKQNYTNQIIYWPMPTSVLNSLPVQARTKFVENIKNEDINEILQKWIYVKPEEISTLLELIINLFNIPKYHGSIAELGAGCGLNSALLANYPDVKEIYAVEYVGQIIKNIMPIIIKHFSPNNFYKIKKTIGSFDNMDIKDNYFDYVFEYMSFHHSDNLDITIQESYRSLKKGGYLIMVDRAQSNNISDKKIQKLLNIEYSQEFKKEYGYPLDMKITRYMNGEREYRINEYKKSLRKAGFRKIKMKNILNKNCGIKKIVLYFIFGQLPYKLQNVILRNIIFWNWKGTHQIFVSQK